MVSLRKSTVAEAAKDDKDIFEVGAANEFAASYPPAPAGESLMTVMSGATKEGSGQFSDWWKSDETQVKFQGLMGVFSALGTGLAGLPAGGTDMSSLERAGVRMAAAGGEARKMIQQRRFKTFIDSELESEKDPHRRLMLQGALANPDQAAQYLSMQSPEAIEGRMVRMENLRAKLGMERVEAEIKGRKEVAAIKAGPSPALMNSIQSANAWFKSLDSEDQRKIREGGFSQAMVNPALTSLIPFLYSPHGGILNKLGLKPKFDHTTDNIEVKPGGDSWVSDIHFGFQSQQDVQESLSKAAANRDAVAEYVSDFWELIKLEWTSKGDSTERDAVADKMFPK